MIDFLLIQFFLYYSETVVHGNCVFVLGEKHGFVTIELSS